MNIHSNGHGKYATHDNEACDARWPFLETSAFGLVFPLSGSPPKGESDEVSLREFHKNWSMRTGSWQPGRVGDFTYIPLQAIIETMYTVSSAAGEAWHMALKCNKELDLLFARDRLCHYTKNPEDLPRVPRYSSTQRYLRKAFSVSVNGITKRSWPRGRREKFWGEMAYLKMSRQITSAS